MLASGGATEAWHAKVVCRHCGAQPVIVLIGGNGFIGRHTTFMAERTGVPVTVVDFAPDLPMLEKHAPGAVAMTAVDFGGERGDELIARADAVVYLATNSVPQTFAVEPWLEVSENVVPAFRVFGRISEINPKARIVLLSSGGTVYGAQDRPLIPETAKLAPISPYGLGKVMIEQALEFYGNTGGQRYAILRASNPVGCWHRNLKQGLVMAVLRALQPGGELKVYGDGSNVRDYIDADDLADAIIRVCMDQTHAGGVWNVGSGSGHSILDIIDVVSSVSGRRPVVRFHDDRGFDVKRIVLAADKIRRDFGWSATTPLVESIQKILNAGVIQGFEAP